MDDDVDRMTCHGNLSTEVLLFMALTSWNLRESVVTTQDKSGFMSSYVVRLNYTYNKMPINATANSRHGKFKNDVRGLIN